MVRSYKKRSDCPGDLEELFEIFRALPPYPEFLTVLRPEALETYGTPPASAIGDLMDLEKQESEKVKQLFHNWFDDLNEPVKEYLKERTRGIFALAFRTVEDLYHSRLLLREIVKFHRLELLERSFKSQDQFEKGFIKELWAANKFIAKEYPCLRFPEEFQLDDFAEIARKYDSNVGKAPFYLRVVADVTFFSGRIEFHYPSLIQTLSENSVAIERIKTCLACDHFYWAKRLDSKTCGQSKCVNDFQNKKKKENREVKQREAEERQRGRAEFLKKDFSEKREK